MKWITLFLVLPVLVLAQKKTSWDTTRYQKFRSNLIVGFFNSYRNFNNEFVPISSRDTNRFSTNYMAESNITTGIDLNYDKFGVSIGLRSQPQEFSQGKGKTNTFNLAFNLGGNKWFLETSYRFFRGFYDVNTVRYDTNFKKTQQYNVQSDFGNKLFRTKFFYFTNNDKYAFRSNYACNYRQLKTSGTWIFSANTNHNYLYNNNGFFPEQARQFYLDLAGLKGLSVFGISANAGAAVTLVIWRSAFLHLMFITGPEQQWRVYHFDSSPQRRLSYLSLSGDFRASVGFNWRRAYMIWSSVNDFVFYNNAVMTLQNRSLGGSFMLGWRFNTKMPEFYKKIQSSKLYHSI